MWKISKRNKCLLISFLLPFSLLFIIFLLIPLIYAVVLAFTDEGFRFTISNFIGGIRDQLFHKALLNTLYYVLGNIVLLVVSIIIAIVISEIRSEKAAYIYQSLAILPYVIPMVVMGIIFKFIYQPQCGIIAKIIEKTGLSQYTNFSILSHSQYAKIAIIIVWIFVYAGYMINIYFSALKEIPISYYEAAQLDGVTWLQKHFYISLPLLGNIFIYTIISGIILSFQIFPLIWILTGSGFGLGAGGPDNSTLSLDLYIYQIAFRDYKPNLASAMGVLMLIMTYIISWFSTKIVKEVQYE